ncbi:MAG TPA: hypothetical protein VKX17_15465, partial [Planctomycetota bacterium]|nr:hypothetical protein [Planctomycetota bacterium]
VTEATSIFFDVVNDGSMPGSTRAAALKAMEARKDLRLLEAVRNAVNDGALRRDAMAMFGKLAPEEAAPKLAEYIDSQTLSNKRFAISTLNEWPGKEAEKLIGGYMDSLLEGRLEKELWLDVLEATAKRAKEEVKKEDPRKDVAFAAQSAAFAMIGLKKPEQYVRPDFKGKLEKFEAMRKDDSVDKFKECLYGGNGGEGRRIFFEKAEASCVRCHKIGNRGGDVGPNLSDIGLRQKREYILESIVDPNKVIAPGYESAMVRTKEGKVYTGVVKKDDANVLVLASADGLETIKKEDIAVRKTGQSPMPQDISKQLNKYDLRDLVEFLAGQRTPPEKPREEDSKHQ